MPASRGIHYRFSTRVGTDMGYRIGDYVVKSVMQPAVKLPDNERPGGRLVSLATHSPVLIGHHEELAVELGDVEA